MDAVPPFADVTTLAAPAFVLAVAWEWWAVRTGHARGRYETRDALASLAMGMGNVVVNTLTASIALWMMMLAWPLRIATIEPGWWSFVLGFVLYDLVYYWKHRLAHRVRWFWMEHVTHHSSRHYNLTTALRQPWFGPFTGLILLGLPLVWLGFHPHMLALIAGLNLIYQFWIHTEAIGRMPRWFEAVMNTPSHHRVHHAVNPVYLDANYAGVFIIWDRMFSTFVEERADEHPRYGIVKQISSHNPFLIAFHELAGLVHDCIGDGWRPSRWVGRLLNAPGWSPDGQHMRSEELRKAFHEGRAIQAGGVAPEARE